MCWRSRNDMQRVLEALKVVLHAAGDRQGRADCAVGAGGDVLCAISAGGCALCRSVC